MLIYFVENAKIEIGRFFSDSTDEFGESVDIRLNFLNLCADVFNFSAESLGEVLELLRQGSEVVGF